MDGIKVSTNSDKCGTSIALGDRPGQADLITSGGYSRREPDNLPDTLERMNVVRYAGPVIVFGRKGFNLKPAQWMTSASGKHHPREHVRIKG